jgi:hypothetical protein
MGEVGSERKPGSKTPALCLIFIIFSCSGVTSGTVGGMSIVEAIAAARQDEGRGGKEIFWAFLGVGDGEGYIYCR